MNSLMITPIGVGIIGVYSAIVCFVILFPLSRRLQHSRWKWWVVSIVGFPILAAPWAEEAWIAWHFNEACKDAGVKVVRQAETDGYVDEIVDIYRHQSQAEIVSGPIDKASIELKRFDDAGYRFVEYIGKDGSVIREQRVMVGMDRVILDRPTAQYRFQFLHNPKQEIRIAWKLDAFGYRVVDGNSGDILGSDRRFRRYPNTAEGLWLQIFGPSVAICQGDAPKPPELRHGLFRYVLIPKKEK